MGVLVCNGAMCQCSFGAAPCTLIATSAPTAMGGSMPLASIMDNTPANLPTFGMCMSIANPAVASATAAALGVLTPQPCVPVVSSPWAPGSPTVIVGGNTALNNLSKAFCAYAGIIQIVNPGQFTVMVP